MTNTSHTEPSVADQLEQVCIWLEELQITLRRTRVHLPAGTLENLSRLIGSLQRISHTIVNNEEQNQNLIALADIGQIVNSSLDSDEVLRVVMDTIVRLTKAERGFLMLKDADGKLSTRIARNWEQETLSHSEYEVSQTIINRVITNEQAVLTTNAREDPRFGGQDSIVAYNLRSILCVPLMSKGDLIGVIYADNRIRTALFSQKDLELLTAFGNQAATAIENARLFESVQQTLREVTNLKNLMDNVFASIASGVITTDLDHTITLCNLAAEKILGQTAEELIGKRLGVGLAPVISRILPMIDDVQQSDQSVIGLEINTSAASDRNQVLQFSLSPLKDTRQQSQGIAIVIDDLTEQKQLKAQRRLFERMVSPKVINELDPDKVALGGSKREISTMFADLRGFTHFSENTAPEELITILNMYIKIFVDAALENDGTVDKIMGDEVMSWFNAPIPQSDHALRAIRSALKIRKEFIILHQHLPEHQKLSFGIGIHYGPAILGLVGCEDMVNFTAIGDSVNTTKRIQQNAKSGQILLSEASYQQVAGLIEVREVEPFSVKGKTKPLNAYELLDVKRRKNY